METSVEEIAPNVFRLSTWIPGITDDGFTFNCHLGVCSLKLQRFSDKAAG